jgi:hypothetical protein
MLPMNADNTGVRLSAFCVRSAALNDFFTTSQGTPLASIRLPYSTGSIGVLLSAPLMVTRSDRSLYARNQFSAINGKCVDLDGFHDGEVSLNVCLDVAGFGIVMNNSNPDMESRNVRIEDNLLDGVKYGGIFVIGAGNAIRRNRQAESEYRALRLLLHGGRIGSVL